MTMNKNVVMNNVREPRRLNVAQNPDGRDIYYDGRKYYYYPINSNKLLEAATLKDAQRGYFKASS